MAVSSNPNAVGDLRIFSREPQRVSGLTSEFQVNSSTQGFQENAAVTGLQDGGWVITWQSPSGGVDGTGGILGQRYDATGVPIGSEFQISTYSPDAQVIPAVTSLADGGFLVSWESFGQDGSNWGIYGQRFNLSGAAVGSEFQINTYTTGPQTDASVSAIADGGWIVTWSSDGQDGLGYGVFARRYDANGLAANPEFRVNTSASGAPFDPSQVDPTIVGLSDGGWVVTWQFTRQGDASSGIFGQRYDSGGLAVGTEFQVNTSTGRLKLYPSTTALNDGGWIVTWSSDGEDGSNWGIFSRRFNSLGDPVGGEVLVNTTTDSYQIQSSVTVLNDGGWVVVWLSNSQQVGGGADVYGQRFSNNGSPVGVEFLINTTTALDQGVPSVAALSDGGWVVSWHSTDGDGSASGVFAQRYDVNGNRGFDLTIPGEIASAADFTEDRTLYADASLITDPDGVGTINWQWQRSLDNGLTWLNIANAIAANYTLGDADVGNLVRVVGAYTDGLGTVETVYSQPSTAVININDAPVLATAIFNQTAVAGAAWSYQLPSDAFTDPDGDALTYSVKMQDGTALPGWLTFDAATRTLSGTAPVNSLGSFNVLVTATDGTASASDIFAINITDVLGQLIDGTEASETLAGTAGADVINGLAGNDIIYGRAGDDVLNGGDGYDQLYGDGGNDILNAGAGGASLFGGEGDDILNGGDGDDYIEAYLGSDVLRGGAGNDRIFSIQDFGLDITRQIEAGSGNDYVYINHYYPVTTRIDLGEGDDRLDLVNFVNQDLQVSLGAGYDRIEFRTINGTLTIADFMAGPQGDVLDWALLQNGQLAGWDGGSNPFGPSGFLRLVQSGADTLLQVDRDGAAVNGANFTTLAALKNVNAANLTAYNFGGFDPRVITYLGTQNADQIVGSDRDDDFKSLAGDDILTGAGGNDSLDGGEGIDTAFYDGSRGDYAITTNADGSISVADNRTGNPNGTDTLVAVERLNIGGTLYALDGKPLITANGGGDAATVSIAENGTAVTRVVATSLNANATLVYSIAGGADAALFQIHPATGELNFKNAPDFETPADLGANNVYDVIVQVSDGTSTDTQAIAITVTNANEAPVITSNVEVVKVGTEFLVNTETANGQYGPTITSLVNGGFVVSWYDDSGTLGDSSGTSIKAQVFGADGTKVGTEFLVNTETANGQYFPSITGLANGGFVVSWYDESGLLPSIKAQVFDADGAKVGTEFLVSTGKASVYFGPTITGLANGGFVVSWDDSSGTLGDTSAWAIKAQVFNAESAKLGTEFLVNTETASSQLRPTIANLANGGFVVSWWDSSTTLGDGSGTSIKAQIFGPDGTKVGTEFLVNTATTSGQSLPTIAVLADSRFVISWNDESGTLGDNSGTSIKAQLFGADGTKVGAEFLVNTATTNGQYNPTITGLANGGFVVSWWDQNSSYIKAQVFSADATKVGGEFLVNTQTTAYQYQPTITGLANGGFVVSWWDQNSANIKAQVFTFNGGDANLAYSIAENTTAVGTVYATDPDAGATLAYSISGGSDAALFEINAATGALSFKSVPDFEAPMDVGSDNIYNVVVQVSDGALTDTETVSINVANVNEAPIITNAISDQSVAEDTAWSYEVPAATFSDVDGDLLTYSATLADGAPLPDWLQFDAVTRTFSGTPTPNFNGNISLTVTASDTSGLTASDTFVLTVNPVEDEATGTLAVAGTVAEGGLVTADLSATDVDGAIVATSYQWQISTNDTDGWIDLSGATAATYAIASDQSQVGKYLRVVATTTDALGGTTEFVSAPTMAIANVNDAPVIAALIADQSATEDATFSFVVPAGSFADVDPGDVLSLSATLADGSVLPTWLTFNPATMTFSGTPLRGDVGTVSVRVTATDNGQLSASDLFDLTVAPETIAPTAIIADNVPGTATGTVLYTVTFSETVTGLAANDFAVTNGTVSSVTGSGTSYVVAVAPTAGFEGNLTLSLNAAAVIDKAGNANAAVNAAAQLVDTRAPVLTTITPAADSIGVAVATNISLAYSEGVRAGTGVIELRTAAGVLVESFNVATSNRLSFTGSSLTIDPTASLNGATQYRLTVPQGAVLDTAGNAAAALATYAFTTQSLANIINGTAVANTLNGTAGDDEIYGLGGNDTLNGNAGNDLLDGGSGVDRMAGGASDDIYVVDNAADTVTEAANAGIDLVRTTRNNYTLTNNVENLTYVGDATFTGTGNGLANRIQGGIGNDLIDGGAGADTMIGGIGNDRYVVDNVGDVVVEQASEGADMVTASMSYVLGANVENLTLSGNAAINGTGNAVANIITGNNGANILRGAGGADTLNGGAGTDTAAFEQAVANYAIDHSGTAIIVSDLVGGEGTDTLTAIETLSFLGSSYNVVAGTGAANIINGGAGSQAIFGLGGADTINGGAGNDIVIGGLGNDNISMASDTGGRDFIDGGAGEDTFTLLTATGAENFVIYTRAAAQQAIAGLVINPNSEIVVTRNGAVMAELDNVEEIVVSSLRVTSPAGANGGAVAGDTVQVVGDFNQTSLNFNTIRVNGTNASDTVDITGLQSEHRIVFTGNGGTDNVVGNLRPQDIFVTDSVAATTSLTASLAASAATSATTSAATSAASAITSAITSTSASLQALKQAAVISAEPVTDDASPQMHRLHHKEVDDSVTSLLRDMFDDSKTGSMFRHWDAPLNRSEAKIDDHPGLDHDAGEDAIKLYDDSWSDVLIRRPDSWHAEFEHLM